MSRSKPSPAPATKRRHRVELDSREKWSVERSLLERQARLEEAVGDTTQENRVRRSGLRELPVINSVLRKLRAKGAVVTIFDSLRPRMNSSR